MSVKSAIHSKYIESNSLLGVNQDVIWQRPSDWLTLETLTSSSQKVIGLFAVFNDDANYVAFIATGNYTVDWGDGTSENVNTGVKAQHRYNWADISSGTLTSEGFRQAIVTITPQAGQTLQTVNFLQYHSDIGVNGGNTTWLELKIAVTSSFTLSNYTAVATTFPYLKIISIDNHGANLSTTFIRGCAEGVKLIYINKALNIQSSGPFQYARSMEYIYINPACTGTDLSNLFLNCHSLRIAPYINTAGVTNFSSMFNGCQSLEVVPTYNTSSCTNFSSMFSGCYNLKIVPFFNTVAGTNFSSMFAICSSLKSVPLYNTAAATDVSNMFQACYSLETVPNFNFSSATTVSSLFSSCYSLKSVPVFSLKTSGTVVGTSMFTNCYSIETIPDMFNNTTLSDIDTIMSSCFMLKKSPALPLITDTSASNPFTNDALLSEIGVFNMSNMASAIPLTSLPLRRSQAFGGKFAINYSSRQLPKEAIDEIISNLGTAATTQTLTITGNPGANRYPILSRSSTTTSGSTTITLSDTSSFVNGMQAVGTGISDARNVTFTDTGDIVTLAAHGISNGKLVSFATITSTTGISVYVPYYVVNATTDTFQLSLTAGGSAIALTTNGSGTMLYQTLVTNIVANTSVTIDIPASASATNTLAYRNLNTQIAVLKRWSITG